MAEDTRGLFIKTFLVIFILSLIVVHIPFLNLLAFLIWPLPVVYVILKQDTGMALKLILLSAIINSLFWGPFMGMVTIVGFGFVGFSLGSCLQAEFSPFKTLLFTIIAVIISQTLLTLITNNVLGLDFAYFLEEIEMIISQTPEMAHLQDSIVEHLPMLILLFPAIIICSSSIMGFLYYYITVGYLSRRGFSLDLFTYPQFWSFPRIPVFLILLLGTFFSQSYIFMNLIFLAFFLLFLQGFAVGLFFTEEILNNSFMKVLFIFLIFVFPLMFIILMVAGFLDMLVNFRKI